MHIDVSSFSDAARDGIDSIARSASVSSAPDYVWTYVGQDIIGRKTAVIGLDNEAHFYLFDPPANSQVAIEVSMLNSRQTHIVPLLRYPLITVFVDKLPLQRAKRSSHMAHMYQIEFLTPCPFL